MLTSITRSIRGQWLVICAAGLVVVLVAWWLPTQAQSPPKPVTQEQMDRWMTELSNWGRWGGDDQLGAVNLITPEKRRQAAQLVKKGISVSLARDIEKEKAVDNPFPFEHVMDWSGTSTPDRFSLDTFRVRYHGWAHTHLDSLCHMFYQGKMYNGFAQAEVTDQGAEKLGVEVLKEGVFTRGILMDIARLKGVPYLEPGYAIYPEDLEAWEEKAGVKVGSGDVLFLRTGRWARREEKGAWDVDKGAAGLHVSCAKWLKERDISFLGSDAASEVAPSGVKDLAAPVHQILLIAMGVPIFDNCDLEAVGKTAAELGRWEFLLTVAPLPVGGGTGSPLNPIATF